MIFFKSLTHQVNVTIKKVKKKYINLLKFRAITKHRKKIFENYKI